MNEYVSAAESIVKTCNAHLSGGCQSLGIRSRSRVPDLRLD